MRVPGSQEMWGGQRGQNRMTEEVLVRNEVGAGNGSGNLCATSILGKLGKLKDHHPKYESSEEKVSALCSAYKY